MFGYGRDGAQMMNNEQVLKDHGSRTARGGTGPGGERAFASNLENPLNGTLDRNAMSKRTTLLDVGMQALVKSPSKNEITQKVGDAGGMNRNMSLGALYNNPYLLR